MWRLIKVFPTAAKLLGLRCGVYFHAFRAGGTCLVEGKFLQRFFCCFFPQCCAGMILKYWACEFFSFGRVRYLVRGAEVFAAVFQPFWRRRVRVRRKRRGAVGMKMRGVSTTGLLYLGPFRACVTCRVVRKFFNGF